MPKGPGRVKGGLKKVRKWKRGHSSSSNPQSSRHREAAKSRYFQFIRTGEHSNLTEKALQRHNDEISGPGGVEDVSSEFGDMSESGRTGGTFMSGLSDCTNPTFNKVKRFWENNSASHKEICAVLAAVTEVIREKGGKETETEYFAALMTTLETVMDKEEPLAASLYLLNLVIKRVPSPVLKAQFSVVSKTLLAVLSRHAGAPAASSLLKYALMSLTTLLKVQEVMTWTDSSTKNLYHTVLSFTVHTRPKVRKAAQTAVAVVLKASNFMVTGDRPPHHPAASLTAKFCIQQIEDCGGSGEAAATLHTLTLLGGVLSTFPQSSLKATCETVLRVMTLGHPVVTSCCMKAFHRMFEARPRPDCLAADLNAQLINALYDYQPRQGDTQPTLAWLAVMEQAHLNLGSLNERLCLSHLPRIFGSAVGCFQSEKADIAQAAAQTLQVLLRQCVLPSAQLLATEAATDGGAPSPSPAHRMFRAVEQGLSYKYHAHWGQVLQVLATFFEVLGGECHAMMKGCLQSLADLRNTQRFSYTRQLDHALGMAVRAMGPKVVLEAIPLGITGEEENCDLALAHSWLLPILRDNVRHTRLDFFARHFLPLASRLQTRALELDGAGRAVEARTYGVLQAQVWSLLRGFCTRPTDLAASFKDLARILGSVLETRPDLRPDVCAALRLLVTKNMDDEENRAVMAKYAKNYLPLLFNIYTGSQSDDRDSSHFAVLETIKVYLTVADQTLLGGFCEKICSKLEEEGLESAFCHSVLDLAMTLVPHLDPQQLLKLYQIIKPLLKERKDQTSQKKAYRVLEEMCGGGGGEGGARSQFMEENLGQLRNTLVSHLQQASSPSKAPRLRCMALLVRRLTPGKGQREKFMGFLDKVTVEVILCLKEVSAKARTAALDLLAEMGRAAIRIDTTKDSKPERIGAFLGKIAAGMVKGSAVMVSATILALTKLLVEFKDMLESGVLELLLDTVCVLLASRTRDVVKSALVFVKALIASLHTFTLAQHLEKLVGCLVAWSGDMRHHFRAQSRLIFAKLIRKFGYEMIDKMVPASYHKMLHNIYKLQQRTKRRKAMKEAAEGEDDEQPGLQTGQSKPESMEELLAQIDSESESDQVDEGPARKKKGQKKKQQQQQQQASWLVEEEGEEEPLDFLDPSAAKKITATKPASQSGSRAGKRRDGGFKTTSDGRLIITEEAKGEGGAPAKGGGRKRKLSQTLSHDDDLGDEDMMGHLLDQMELGKSKKKKKKGEFFLEDDEDEDMLPKTYTAGGTGIHRPITKKGVATSQERLPPGAEYRAKKAGGDIKKKGKPDPYAYLPLNLAQLNKRKRAKNSKQWNNLIHAAKKGATQGSKRNQKGRKRKC